MTKHSFKHRHAPSLNKKTDNKRNKLKIAGYN